MSKNRDKVHKARLAARKTRLEKEKEERNKAFRNKILKNYNGESKVFPMPTLIESLAEQGILQSETFLRTTQTKILDWFDLEIKNRAKQTGTLNYLPDKVISFLIPLDFYLPLPNNYVSGSISAPNGKILEANCVTNTTRIVGVGKSAIKMTYLVVSLCSDEVTKDINLKTPSALMRNFERAIVIANSVIASFQAIPTRHNHYLHRITSFSCPSKLEFFVFNRRTRQILKKTYQTVRDNVFSDIYQSRPLDMDELNFYKNCHVRETFSDDKIFELVSMVNQATNARCFGSNDDSILYADKFASFSMGYLYCEIRVMHGEDRKDVYEDYKKKDEKKILSGLWQLLGFVDKETFKIAIGYDDWYEKCHLRRNGLNHQFLTGGFNGKESEEALYYSVEMIRKTCEIVVGREKEEHPEFIEKIQFLHDATHFPKFMHESNERNREKLLSM